MAERSLGHRPNLTADALMKLFENHFADKYDIYPTPGDVPWSLRNTDFIIRKSDIAAIGVRLKQQKSDTKIEYKGDWAVDPPFSWFRRRRLRRQWRRSGVPYRIVLAARAWLHTAPMEGEVGEFIDTGLEAGIEELREDG